MGLLDIPEILEKKIQISSDRICPLTEPIAEFVGKPVKGEETVLLINKLINLSFKNALHQELESQQLLYGF